MRFEQAPSLPKPHSFYLLFSSHHDLPCPLTKRFPIIPTIDSINAETRRQEKQLQFAREKDMHVQPGQITFVFATLKKLLMCPQDMLQLLDSIILAAGIQ